MGKMIIQRELTLKEIQQGEFEVLKKLKSICDELELNYFLFCGTLIGAIRHNGFIPWDDDVDVAMLRKDYEKLIYYCNLHAEELLPFKLYHYTSKKDYIYPIARLVDTRYSIVYKDAKDYDLGLFVDIYPLDGCGNTKAERDIIFSKVRKNLISLISLGARTNILFNHGLLNYITKGIIKGVAMLIGQNRLCRWIDNRAKKYCPKDSDFSMCIIWDSFSIDFFPTEYFKEYIEIPFEDELFKIPSKYDIMLRSWYGDYMRLPPIEERIGHHYYKAYQKV